MKTTEIPKKAHSVQQKNRCSPLLKEKVLACPVLSLQQLLVKCQILLERKLFLQNPQILINHWMLYFASVAYLLSESYYSYLLNNQTFLGCNSVSAASMILSLILPESCHGKSSIHHRIMEIIVSEFQKNANISKILIIKKISDFSRHCKYL